MHTRSRPTADRPIDDITIWIWMNDIGLYSYYIIRWTMRYCNERNQQSSDQNARGGACEASSILLRRIKYHRVSITSINRQWRRRRWSDGTCWICTKFRFCQTHTYPRTHFLPRVGCLDYTGINEWTRRRVPVCIFFFWENLKFYRREFIDKCGFWS